LVLVKPFRFYGEAFLLPFIKSIFMFLGSVLIFIPNKNYVSVTSFFYADGNLQLLYGSKFI